MIDSPWLTAEQVLARYHLKAKTARVHLMFCARAGRIPGAKKIMGKWVFHKDKLDQWDENKRR